MSERNNGKAIASNLWPDFDVYVSGASDIFIAGGSLDLLIRKFCSFLVEKANSGCNVRIILMDPNSSAIPQVGRWSGKGREKIYRDDICNSLDILAAHDTGGNLQVRLNPTIPALTVMLFDVEDDQRGRARVCLQPFQANDTARPEFEFTAKEDPVWFSLFKKQYSQELWAKSKQVNLSNLKGLRKRQKWIDQLLNVDNLILLLIIILSEGVSLLEIFWNKLLPWNPTPPEILLMVLIGLLAGAKFAENIRGASTL